MLGQDTNNPPTQTGTGFKTGDQVLAQTQLIRAIRLGNVQDVQQAIKRIYDINEKDENGYTPLHEAVSTDTDVSRDKQKEIIEALIKGGANVNAVNNIGETPMHLAANYIDTEVITQLISNGADVNIPDRNGRTPLDMLNESMKNTSEEGRANGQKIRQALIDAGAKTRAELLNASEYPDIQTIDEKQYAMFVFSTEQSASNARLSINNIEGALISEPAQDGRTAVYVPLEHAETARSAFGLPSKNLPSPAPVGQAAQQPPAYQPPAQQPPAYQAPAQQPEAAKETKGNPATRFFKEMGQQFKNALNQNRYVSGFGGKVADAYKPSRNPLSWLANGANFVANAVGAGIKAATWGIGEGLKRLGTLAGKPFEMSRDLITKENATIGQRIGGVIGMIAATPLKALGMATSIAGQAVKSTGEVAANVMAVGGAMARGALSFGSTTGNAGNVWKQVTKTIASVGHVATDLVKETGTQVKELGNQAAIPGVSHVLRGAGALVQGVAQVGEGALQGARKLAVGEGKEAGKLFGQSVASGAKTFGNEVRHMGQEIAAGVKEGKVVSGRNVTHTPETRMMPESVDISRKTSAYKQSMQDKSGQETRHTPSQSDAVEAARAGTKRGFDVETDTAMKKAAVEARPLKDLEQEVENQQALKQAAGTNKKHADKADKKLEKANTKLKEAKGEYQEAAKEASGKFSKMVEDRAKSAKTTMGRQ